MLNQDLNKKKRSSSRSQPCSEFSKSILIFPSTSSLLRVSKEFSSDFQVLVYSPSKNLYFHIIILSEGEVRNILTFRWCHSLVLIIFHLLYIIIWHEYSNHVLQISLKIPSQQNRNMTSNIIFILVTRC